MNASPAVLAAVLLAAASSADAASSTREPLVLQEPKWKGGSPALVSPGYRDALAALQAIASDHPEGAPLRVTSPAPCILRLARGSEVAAFADAESWFLHQVTWIDLTKATEIGAQAFGRKADARPSMAATCAWLSGASGFALSTEIVALAGKPTAIRRTELAPEEQPRLCVGNEVEPGQVEGPLRALVAACGGGAGARVR